MAHPAAYIVFGVVLFAAAIIGVLTATNERPQIYENRRFTYGQNKARPSPPPSPLPSAFVSRSEKRRRSPQRSKKSPDRESVRESTKREDIKCTNCDESPFLKVFPCQHASMCKGCFKEHLKNHDTCPKCTGRIDSLLPSIEPFEKCKNCRQFTTIFKFTPCNHSLGLCFSCFESKNKSYKVCPECKGQIRGCKPHRSTLGICDLCREFTKYAKFHPCGHGNFCKKDADAYLKNSQNECFDCGKKVYI